MLPYTFKPQRYSSHRLLLERAPAPGGGRRVLDVGCAEGYLSTELDARGYCVTALDRPGVTPLLPSRVRFVEADLDAGLPPLLSPFDYIICGDVLEHLRDPVRMLKDLAALLAPAGRIIASLPNGANLYVRLHVLFGRFPEHDRGLFDRTHLHFCHFARWQALFARAGLRIDKVRPTPIPFTLALPNLDRLPRAMESAWYGLARARKELFAYQFIVDARPAHD